MKRILVAVNGSDAAYRATHVAAQLAGAMKARLLFAHVVERPLPLPEGLYSFAFDDLHHQEEMGAKSLLKQTIEHSGRADSESMILRGPTAEAIADAAEESDVDLIVVGSRGRGNAARVLLGSTSDRLAQISKRSVLVVK